MLCETMNQIGPSLSRLRWLIFLIDFFNWKQDTLEISNLWSPDKLYIQSPSEQLPQVEVRKDLSRLLTKKIGFPKDIDLGLRASIDLRNPFFGSIYHSSVNA